MDFAYQLNNIPNHKTCLTFFSAMVLSLFFTTTPKVAYEAKFILLPLKTVLALKSSLRALKAGNI